LVHNMQYNPFSYTADVALLKLDKSMLRTPPDVRKYIILRLAE